MPTLRRTIRLFVSSTFSDMKAERDILQSDVFPRLRQLCLSNGLRFQPIDLRWGVPEDASKDNRTMRICLRELDRCQQERLKPNFLILLGDRYGWRPLPEIIPADLFAQLREHLPHAIQDLCEWRDTQSEDAKGWYRRDDNAVPPVYELRPRGDDEIWHESVELPLVHAFETAAREIGLGIGTHGVSIGASATEQEIIEGALKVDDAADHVHAFFRSIVGLPKDPLPQSFVDVLSDGTQDAVAAAQLRDLKTRIECKIGPANVHQYTVPWCDGGVRMPDLTQFGQDVYAALRSIILRQVAELTSTTGEAQEDEAHRAFGDERCRGFIGRAESLTDIAAYLRSSGSGLVAIVGSSGSGKSALIAEAVRRARETYGDKAVLARFIGATPESADLLSLLRNLVIEIRRRYPASQTAGDGEIPVEINPLIAAFHYELTKPTAAWPLVIFVDAMDQLTSANGAFECRWLPGALNPHARLIVSTALPETAEATSGRPAGDSIGPLLSEQDPRAVVLGALEQRELEVQHLPLHPLSPADGQALLDGWLAEAGRTLQPRQKEAIVAAFAHYGNPLWLRAATTVCRNLASWDTALELDPALPRLMRQVLDRLSGEDEHGALLVERALLAIAATRHGLAEDELLDVLSADLDVLADLRRRSPRSPVTDALPIALWVRLYGDIAPFVTEHQFRNVALLTFYHRIFLEAVQTAFLDSSEKRRVAHQRLADLFGAHSWFIAPVDERGRVMRPAMISDPPDARKASELPWHLLSMANTSDPGHERPADWDTLVAVLCDIEFVEAKCRAGFVSELQEDYRDARTELPEAREIWREEHRHNTEISRWTDEIIRYAESWSARRDRIARGEPVDEPETVLPATPASCRIWTNEEIEAKCRRIRNAPTRFDRLTSFAGFVQGEYHLLVEFGGREGFTIQHASNYEPAGSVHDAARGRLEHCNAPLLIRRWPKDAVWNPKPAMLRTLQGHREWVTSVSVTPDGRRAVSGGHDNALRVWDLESGRCERVLEGHRDHIESVSVTLNGRCAVTGSWHDIRVWDLETGRCNRTLKVPGGLLKSIGVTPDGRRAVSGGSDRRLHVWDLESGTCLRTLEGHSSNVNSVSVTPDGRHAVSGGSDSTLRVWDLENGACLRTLKGQDYIHAVGMTPDGRRAVAGGGNTLQVWDLESGDCLRTLKGHRGQVECVCLTPNGQYAVSGGGEGLGDYAMRLWDVESGTCLRTLEGHNSTITSVSVTPDGRRAVSGSQDETLRVWDLESGYPRTLIGHGSFVWCVSVAPDGRHAVSGSRDRTLRVWDLESAACLRTLEGHRDSVEIVCVTPDGLYAVSGSMDRTLRVWDLESGTCLHTLEGHRDDVTCVCITPDGQRAVSGSQEDATVRVWDLKSGVCLGGWRQDDFVWDITLTADGRHVVSAAESKLHILDLESGAHLRTLQGHSNRVRSVRVTPDGRRVVSGGDDATVRVWDLQSGACLRTLRGHKDCVWGVAVTPDGRRAVSASRDTTLRVWDLENGACLHKLEGHRGDVYGVSVTPDGQRAVSKSGDAVRVWDLESGTCLALLCPTAPTNTVADVSTLIAIGTQARELLLVETLNLLPGPVIAPDTSDMAYEASLHRGLDFSRSEKDPDHEETRAHMMALAALSQRRHNVD